MERDDFDPSAEMRIRYAYSRKIISGKIKTSLEAAKLLVGPDRAYHLYHQINSHSLTSSEEKEQQKSE